MATHSIADKVAIVSMGCTTFGEHFDRSTDDLLVDAVHQAWEPLGFSGEDIDAFWIGTYTSGIAGLTLSRPLRLDGKPVTRVENMCATGSDSFRNAAYAVASGAIDVAMAVGVEKLKDNGFSGLTTPRPQDDGTRATSTAPANFSFLAPAYQEHYGVSQADFRQAMTHVAWKNHANGALNPRAQFRKQVSKETIENAPNVAGQLGVFDCSGIADGAAAAVLVRAEDAHRYTDRPLYVKALSLAAGYGAGTIDPMYDYTTFHEVTRTAADAYAQAGITDPRSQLAMAEVHDCFTPTEIVLMEDLGFSARGMAWKDCLAGAFDLHGDLPVNPDGGLKSFGHPVGATGLRMLFEAWLQLREEAGQRQIDTASRGLALTHNLGGQPGDCVSFVSIVGSRLG
jgi:acetyl-CoA C-acetyltransferase